MKDISKPVINKEEISGIEKSLVDEMKRPKKKLIASARPIDRIADGIDKILRR